jgi:hypothetical protein
MWDSPHKKEDAVPRKRTEAEEGGGGGGGRRRKEEQADEEARGGASGRASIPAELHDSRIQAEWLRQRQGGGGKSALASSSCAWQTPLEHLHQRVH